MKDSPLLALVVVFGSLSLIAVGGTNTIIPQMHQEVVKDHDWLSDVEFADVFAIAQAAPGPSTLIVTLIGYKVAGLLGAIVATLAMITLPSLLTYILTYIWERAHDSKWRQGIEHGLAPITIGLIFASGWVVGEAADHGIAAYALTAVATLLFVTTRINPLIIVGACGLLGVLGLVQS